MNKRRQILLGLCFTAIPITGFFIFFTIPFVMSLVYSFDKAGGGFVWNGIGNYRELIKSPAFTLACKNTFRFIGAGLPFLLAFSLSMALMIDAMFRNKTKFHSLLFAINLCPMVIPSSAIIFFLQIMFERYGVVNSMLVSIGKTPVDFIQSSAAFNLLLLLYIWKNYSYCMVIFVAGLKGIDKMIYEAASLDGAGTIRRFLHITLPGLASLLMFAAVMSITGVFKLFRESYLLFGNYPHESVYMLQNFMNNNFYSFNYQQLSASSIAFFLIMSIFVVMLLKFNWKEQGV